MNSLLHPSGAGKLAIPIVLIAITTVSAWAIYAQDSVSRPNRIPVGSFPQSMYGTLSPEFVAGIEPKVRKRLQQMQVRPVRNLPTVAHEEVPASHARIRPDTRVVGVTINGESKAYALTLPQRNGLLAGINDEVGGRKILVTH